MCGTPLIWVPTQSATTSGRSDWIRGRIMSMARIMLLAVTLFGEISTVSPTSHSLVGMGSGRLRRMKSTRDSASSAGTKMGR